MFYNIKLLGVLESTPYGVQIAHYHLRFGELSIPKLNRKNLCLRFEPVKAENLRSFYSISTYEKDLLFTQMCCFIIVVY